MSVSIAFKYKGATITLTEDVPGALVAKVESDLPLVKAVIDDHLKAQQGSGTEIPSTCSKCGGVVEYQEWTRRSDGKEFRAYRCLNSRVGELHDIEWVNG